MTIIKIQDVSVQFPGVKALNQVTFEIEKGKVMALCGENGAGKSTLGKLIAGVYPYGFYEGKILYEGAELKLSSTLNAEKLGIAIVHQELNQFHEMTVAENIFLSNMPNRRGIIDFDALNEQTEHLLQQIDLQIDPRTKIKDLTVSRRQMIEIAKAIAKKPKVLVFDEATSSLTDYEVAKLFTIIRTLKEQGTTMIYVSHKLTEIFEICDSVTILKDGVYVRSANVKDISKDDIVRWMVGRELEDLYPPKFENKQSGKSLLHIQNWNVLDSKGSGKKIINNLSFDVKGGEILGIYGLVGAGRTELVTSLFEGREDAFSTGKMFIAGKEVVIKNPAHAIEHGIALITEDRKRTGLVLGLSVKHNIALASLKKVSSKWGVIEKQKNDDRVQSIVNRLRVKVPNVEYQVKLLSGGNQQKVVLGKWLLTKPKILILDEPTRGIDIGAKAEIYKMMQELADGGIAIIMISSELPEILGVSDRVLVMKNGEITGEIQSEVANEETLIRYAMGDEVIAK